MGRPLGRSGHEMLCSFLVYITQHSRRSNKNKCKMMNFDWMSFNFEDVKHDYFPIFLLKAFKPEPRRAGQRFFCVLYSPVTHQGSTCSL